MSVSYLNPFKHSDITAKRERWLLPPYIFDVHPVSGDSPQQDALWFAVRLLVLFQSDSIQEKGRLWILLSGNRFGNRSRLG